MAHEKSICRNSIPYSPFMGEALGTCSSLLIQQIYYWTLKKQHSHEGHYWCYNTYQTWADQLRAFDPKTIYRALTSLREKGIVRVGNFNKHKYDKTLWYRVDSQALLKVLSEKFPLWTFWLDAYGQIDQTPMVKMSKPIPETSQKTNSELASQKIIQKPTGKKIIIMAKGPTTAALILKDQQNKKANKGVIVTKPNSIDSMVDIWHTVVPEFNEGVKCIAAFTIVDKGKLGKMATLWGNDTDKCLRYVLSHWIAFTKFVEDQVGVKTTPASPTIRFLLKYVGEAKSFMVSSVQLTAPKKIVIKPKVKDVGPEVKEPKEAKASLSDVEQWLEKLNTQSPEK